ncbi:cell surface protein [Tenacibaculum piscium]|uniref:YncE family protein n=1 Tax=Tenacibaculum piscium TaxID=1458515 RepID=UPI00187B5641|nr:cell surface protein [Tenacibaculum piscium]MBE7685775.1 cell surface protein [Tenacibaculum piscium]MBE7690230.1 cell surface protein [Tenacibaculum piscium]
MKITKLLLALFLANLLLTSCAKDEDEKEFLVEYKKGIIISSEGNFGDKDGSIAYVDNALSNVATNFIYTGENNAQLGGLIQSITFTDTEAYIILNDVNTIIIADKTTFKKKTEIKSGLKNPRYMTVVGDKGYVTNWGDGGNTKDDYIAIINLKTNKIEPTTISLENGVEQILNKDNKLYVSHKGAWSSSNIISVVDLNAKNSVSKIIVKDNPDEMAFDNAGNLIVLSEGKPVYNADWSKVIDRTTAAISFINVSTKKVVKELAFPKMENASLMTYQNGNVYYYTGKDKKVHSINETATKLATEGINVGAIYGMNVKQNQLFTVEYAFTKLSKLKVFDVNTKSEIYTSPVGLGASKIYFNN